MPNFQLFKLKSIFTLLLLTFSYFHTSAQYNETIRTARPGKSVGPFTTGKSIFQIQSGLNIFTLDNDEADVSGNVVTQFNSLRYGVSERFEIRSAFSYRNETIDVGDTEFKAAGVNFWNVGVRLNLTNNAGTNKPSIGLQGDVGLKTVSSDYEPEYLSPRLLLILGTRLYKSMGLTANLGTQWSSATGKQSAIYTLNLGFPITNKLRSFIESYGSYQEGDLTARFDTGLGYLINNDFAIDISAGYGDNNSQTDYFMDFGLSYRIRTN
ncbi:transporter [Fulvivirga lutimaris]|uniref:transporter n=1 Tax=Fulvivirga lutimaris TaxID=1819566 RepID=UPI0012BD4C00|nr:transporter [Fulvivirga lutimaris]MTI40739.1 transporter [Fulvivirga lutimaris]